MEMSSPRPLEASHAVISSKRAKLHTDARHAVQMTHASSVATATILQTIQATWYMSAFRWVIAVVATAGTLRHGGFQYTVQYTHHTKMILRAGTKERRQLYRRTWLKLYA